MTNEESDILTNDVVLRGRIKIALLKFITYVLAESKETPAHATRLRYAQKTALQPAQAAMDIQPMVVMDPTVQANWPVTDEQLQSAVETVINTVVI
jgi:hypothetical protein